MTLEVQDLTPDETLERITHYARVAVDAADTGVMLVKARGRIDTAAATSADVEKAHMLQDECDEGPCLEAIRGGDAVYVTGDAPTDPRWSSWGSRVAELGYRSIISVRLQTPNRIYGSLNVYSIGHDDFSAHDVEVMEYLGVHASAAIAASQATRDLCAGLESRALIGQAQGVLMAIYNIDAHDAFHCLRRYRRTTTLRCAKSLSTLSNRCTRWPSRHLNHRYELTQTASK
jgi:GAF domain-containing protein